jgi:hypothetical protein
MARGQHELLAIDRPQRPSLPLRNDAHAEHAVLVPLMLRDDDDLIVSPQKIDPEKRMSVRNAMAGDPDCAPMPRQGGARVVTRAAVDDRGGCSLAEHNVDPKSRDDHPAEDRACRGSRDRRGVHDRYGRRDHGVYASPPAGASVLELGRVGFTTG